LEAARYEFRIVQRLSATAVEAFPELSATDGSQGTVLYGAVRDDAELHGILARLQLLGVTILDVHRLPD
jgi:regulator of RNase E activity RraA